MTQFQIDLSTSHTAIGRMLYRAGKLGEALKSYKVAAGDPTIAGGSQPYRDGVSGRTRAQS